MTLQEKIQSAVPSLSPEQAQAVVDALPGMVPGLKWAKSHIDPWDGDYHSLPTGYTIRGLGNEDYKLIFAGGFSVHNSPEAAMAEGNRISTAAVIAALMGEA